MRTLIILTKQNYIMKKLIIDRKMADRETADRAPVTTRKISGFLCEVNATLTILSRRVLLTLKSPSTLIMSLAMPIVMMGMVGGNLSQNMAGGLGFDYGQFMLI
jgi:hypothetical protein